MYKKIIASLLFLFVTLINFNTASAATLPPAVKHEWDSSTIKVIAAVNPIADLNNQAHFVYSLHPESEFSRYNDLNSYIVFDNKGKAKTQVVGSKNLSDIKDIIPLKDGTIALDTSYIKKLDSKGQILWTFKIQNGYSSFLGYSGYLFAYTPKNLYKIDPKSGKVIWTYKLSSSQDISFDPKNENFLVINNKQLDIIKNNKKILTKPLPKEYDMAVIEGISSTGTFAIKSMKNKSYEELIQVYTPTGSLKWQKNFKDGAYRTLFNSKDNLLVHNYENIMIFDEKGKVVSNFKYDSGKYSDLKVFNFTGTGSMYFKYWDVKNNKLVPYIDKLNKNGVVIARSELPGSVSNNVANHNGVIVNNTVQSYKTILKFYSLQ